MKTLREKINWYCEFETRKWKRIYHCVEMSLISFSAIAIIIVVQIYGDDTRFQPVLIFFTSIIAMSSGFLVVPFYQSITFKRWHVQIITLGFGCGMGVSALAAFVILELQFANI